METPAALPRPPESARCREAAGGTAESRAPLSSAASAVRDVVLALHSCPPEGYDLPSRSFPPVPCEAPELFSRSSRVRDPGCSPAPSCLPGGKRASTALSRHGLPASGVLGWSRGTRDLLPPASPARDRGCGPSGLPAPLGCRPRWLRPGPAHLGPAAGSSLPELSLCCGGRRGELPQPQEQRQLRPSGLSRRGRGSLLGKAVWFLSGGSAHPSRAAAFQGSRPRETSGNGNPIPRAQDPRAKANSPW